MAGTAAVNTNPEDLAGRIALDGPAGFVMSVFDTLRRLGRPYYYTSYVPEWIAAGKTGAVDTAYRSAYQREFDAEPDAASPPHIIVYNYRTRPANRVGPHGGDNAGGNRRSKLPAFSYIHTRTLPESEGEQRPLWRSEAEIPDLLRPYIDKDTPVYVAGWRYEVFIDFTVIAGNDRTLETISADLFRILRTLYDRSLVGSTNRAGDFYENVGGVSKTIPKLREGLRARTITWMLNTTEIEVMPASILREIDMTLGLSRPTI